MGCARVAPGINSIANMSCFRRSRLNTAGPGYASGYPDPCDQCGKRLRLAQNLVSVWPPGSPRGSGCTSFPLSGGSSLVRDPADLVGMTTCRRQSHHTSAMGLEADKRRMTHSVYPPYVAWTFFLHGQQAQSFQCSVESIIHLIRRTVQGKTVVSRTW